MHLANGEPKRLPLGLEGLTTINMVEFGEALKEQYVLYISKHHYKDEL